MFKYFAVFLLEVGAFRVWIWWRDDTLRSCAKDAAESLAKGYRVVRIAPTLIRLIATLIASTVLHTAAIYLSGVAQALAEPGYSSGIYALALGLLLTLIGFVGVGLVSGFTEGRIERAVKALKGSDSFDQLS